ncbi:MAG TPA: SDR family NAD(P)-dependent oxidoreductase [Thermoanaerobaculia bacterium]|nr:SDR family NAD(P)-dependent oxidoreductase [Thermoanaerobaculia bacterium]
MAARRGSLHVALAGGTRGMGRALARELVARGHRVALLGRDAEQLQRSGADLAARAVSPTRVPAAELDLLRPETFGPALDAADAAFREEGGSGLDTVILTAAEFATQDQLEADPDRLQRLLAAAFTNSILFCEDARRRLLARGGGTLCVFASVAGDRARKPSTLYGAAKAGLAYYLDGLDLRYGSASFRVIVVKPGFIRTGMTQGLPEPPFAADPEPVARRVADAVERGRHGVLYAPPVWRLIMAVIRRLPRAVMRRARF